MSVTNSPNMNLPVPNVGLENGPQYATDVNNSLNIIDQHTHAAGSGVQITPAGINISTALPFNNNLASSLAGLTLIPQVSTPTINTIYESGVDLFYVDGNGNNIRITQSGAVAGTPGSISNLVSPASAAYVASSSTFVFESGTGIAGNLDAGALLMRNLTPNSTFALTLEPPAALGSNYTLTLPTLPAVQSILSLDPAGAIVASYTVDNSTIEIASNVIQVKDQGITAAKILNSTITTSQIAAATILGSNIASATVTKDNIVAPSYASAALTSGSSPSSTIVGTVVITGTGRPVVINFQQFTTSAMFLSAASMSLVILKDGTSVIGRINAPAADLDGAFRINGATLIDTTGLSPGAHTYQVLVEVSSVGPFIVGGGVFMTAYEIT